MESNVKIVRAKYPKILAGPKFSGVSRFPASSLGIGRVDRGLFFSATSTSNIYATPCPPYF